ncbi:hypothetical protein GYMLUDRAFT_172033 [Collybiopsis luxurians FD-317 M1]|uniref:Enoyl reductase (ER) domain-containing protein n=1 Tax=Collybiopsis luxurians FD-317 M1 TaxID=944289 RepID=A0A0D0BRB1_9AGAR|nr:hypothetical protein GYMLUDRAFT_172033 [Collybiopsis luxurians FD-317 M1]
MSSHIQKALILEEAKGPFVITTVDIPKPGPDEILVKVRAAALNPYDWAIQSGMLPNITFPVTVGVDIAGDVEEIGEGVQEYAKGDRVFFPGQLTKGYGGYQQYTLVPVRTVGKIPPHLSYAEAASIPLCFATAAFPLLRASPLGAGLNPTFDPKVSFSGETALVIGGGSSVGQFAIQILKYLGFSTIITYASAKHTDYLQSIGATHIVDRASISLTDLPAHLKQITSSLIKTIYVAIPFAPEAQDTAYASLAPGGAIAIAHPVPSKPEDAEAAEKKIYGVFASTHLPQNRNFGTLMWKEMPKLVHDGIIKPNRVEILPGGLNAVAGGVKRVQAGEVSGVKLVVNPQETE